MALFCPSCHNMLLVRQEAGMQFHCRTCPYVFTITEKFTRKQLLTPKQADEPIDFEEQENQTAARAPASCPNCSHTESFFYELQLRSADEPSTIFFRCCKCRFRWREN